MKTVNVVCAIITNENGDYLLAQRSDKMPHSGFWEFAGGKVEQDEDDVNALKREISEELGCSIDVGLYFDLFLHDYGNVNVEIRAYFAKITDGYKPVPIEHSNLMWIKLVDALSIELLESNKQIVDRLLEIK